MSKLNGRIKNPVALGFNPKKGNKLIQEIFNDRIARTLCLAIKQQGPVNKKYFGKNCLAVSDYLKTHPNPRSVKELKDITDTYILDENGDRSDYSIGFLNELYVYLFNNKKLECSFRGKILDY